MRLITRADFDGIVCGAIITCQLAVDEICFAEPKSMQDREVVVSSEDIITNLPYHPNCYLWFDHHFTNQISRPFRGSFRLAPSAARVVFEYYASEALMSYEEMVREADRIDSGNLELSDILSPKRYVLLSFTLDPAIKTDEHYWVELIHLLRDKPVATAMEHPEVKRRCDQVLDDFKAYRTVVLEDSRRDGDVVVTDFRKASFSGKANRFLVYSLFPDATVSVKIFKDSQRAGRTGISVGKNIFNKKSTINVGELLSHYGGGGHSGAGSCRVADEDADKAVDGIISALKSESARVK